MPCRPVRDISKRRRRATRVAHYVSIDGQIGAALPGGVPTLALWAEHGTAGRTIVGAENVMLENQTHVQAATSAEAFGHMFQFLTGGAPKTTAVTPDFCGNLAVSGRAVLFPQNIGVEGALLQIHEISGASGQRVCKKPAAEYTITADGNWGPFKAKPGRNYEFVLVREGQEHHFYKEPFIRDDHFVRLNASPLGGGVGANMDFADGQSNLVIARDKESWGDQGVENTILAVNGVNIVECRHLPHSKRTTSFFVYDLGSDGASSVEAPIAYLPRPGLHHRRGSFHPGGRSHRQPHPFDADGSRRQRHHAGDQRAQLVVHEPPHLGAVQRLRAVGQYPALIPASNLLVFQSRSRPATGRRAAFVFTLSPLMPIDYKKGLFQSVIWRPMNGHPQARP